MAEASRSHESHQTFERHNKKAQVSVAQEENLALICANLDKVNIAAKYMMDRMDQLERKFNNPASQHHTFRVSHEPTIPPEEAN